MSAIARCRVFLVLMLAIVSCSWQPLGSKGPTAEKIRASSLVRAKKEGKLVLLVFGFHDQSWSDRLDEYHAEPDIARVLAKHFVLASIDVDEITGGMEMYLERGSRGFPAFSILDSSGEFLVDSGQDDQNFGFPNNDEQVDRYIAALTTACPKLTSEDIAVLRDKLEQMRAPPGE